MCGDLTRIFGRSQRLNSIRCGVISILANRKGPKYWLGERDARARDILWNLQVRLPTFDQETVAYLEYSLVR